MPAPVVLEDHDLMAGGRRLRVRRLTPPGARAEPVLVFLHEGLGSIAQWRDFPAALASAAGLPALVYDRYGHGASESREGGPDLAYLVEEAERLRELLATCGLRRPVLVGHSDGATLALLHAAAHPGEVAAVLAEAPHTFVEPEARTGIARARAAWPELRERLRRHHGAGLDAMFRNWAEVWLDPAHACWDARAQLGRITAPVLVLQGEADAYGTPAQVEAIVQGVAGPVRAALLPACGHAPHLEAREATLAAMLGFLGEFLT